MAVGRTRIKFCGLVRPEDVDTAVALGVDAIGFVFYPRSPRYVRCDEAAILRRLLPSWVIAVGLFVDAETEQVREHSRVVGLDVVQFHGDESPDDCHAALATSTALSLTVRKPYWRAVRMRSADDLITSVSRFGDAEAFVVDAWSDGFGGSGKTFEWSWVPRNREWSLILSGGLDADNVGAAIRQLAPVLVDVSSGIQGANPRVKDKTAMESFVAAVTTADAESTKRMT